MSPISSYSGTSESLFVWHAKHGRHIGIMSPVCVICVVTLLVLDRRDAAISFKLYRRVKYHYIQVEFEKWGNPQNFD